MNPIIIMQVDLIEEQEFTFDNFDELKGYLKGKTIYSPNMENFYKVKEVLGLLGFRHEARWVEYRSDDDRVIEVENDSYIANFAEHYEDYDINGEELLEDYYKLKEALVYSIIPWPITVTEAREMTNYKLCKLNLFAEQMVDALEDLGLEDDSVEGLMNKNSIKSARQLIDNYEIQHDNLKFIW